MDRLWIALILGLSVANGWGGERLPEIPPKTAEALRKLKLPGIHLNLNERAIDVNATASRGVWRAMKATCCGV